MLRLFVAIELTDGVRDALATVARQLSEHPGGRHVRWTNLELSHLTLKFLGDTPESTVATVERSLAGVAEGVAPLGFRLSHVGAFPNRRRPRVIWVGLDAGDDETRLNELHGTIERDLARLGFAGDDRPFSPHLTLGRVHQGLRPAEEAQVAGMIALPVVVEPVTFRARSIALMSSTLRPDGPVYRRLAEASFAER